MNSYLIKVGKSKDNQCYYPKFNPHFRLFLAVTVLSSFFLWTLCPTNFILFEW